MAIFRSASAARSAAPRSWPDGYHARTDGFTSLAVVLGAVGVWLGFPLADPIVGLLITIAIFGIVWQSARAVVTRMLDGVEPDILDEIDHVAEHVAGIDHVHAVQARWIATASMPNSRSRLTTPCPLHQAQSIVARMRSELFAHLPVLSQVSIRIEPLPQGKATGDHLHDTRAITPDRDTTMITTMQTPTTTNTMVIRTATPRR